MFLKFQLLEERFKKPSMAGRHDKPPLASPVIALDKCLRSAELDELGHGLLSPLATRGNGAPFVD